MVIGTDILRCRNANTQLQNSGYQPGSARVVAVFRPRCGRNPRISAERMRSVA